MAIADVYEAWNNQWERMSEGVACLVHDPKCMKFFIRVMNPALGLVLEQELHDDFEFEQEEANPLCYIFPMAAQMAALSFTSEASSEEV